MNVAHIVLTALAGGAFVAVAATGRKLRRASGGVHVQFVALVTAAALVVGNAACVLPSTPRWYSTALIVATAAGLGWLTVTLLQTLYGAARHPAAGQVILSGTLVEPAASTESELATVHHIGSPASRALAGPKLVTAHDLHDRGPAGSRVASSNTVYVATNLGSYLPPSPTERRSRAVRNRRRRDPSEAMRRLRVAQAYNQTPARESRVWHTL